MQLPETWLGISSLIILCMAVTGGALTAFVRLADKNTPVDTGLIHGRAGVFATILLVISIFIGDEPTQGIKPVIGLLILTVLAGVALYFIIRRKGILPKSIMFIHGMFAVTAVYTFLYGFPFLS